MNYIKMLKKDSKAKVLLKAEIDLPTPTKSILMSLVSSILSQQLSVAVARVMRTRFLALYGGKNPTAEQIMATPVETIKGIGISQSKANYIKNVAEFVHEHKITVKSVKKMSDDELIDLLSQIKGVGRWTVEMLLIFGLQREDVFAVDDLGVQKAMLKLFRLQKLKKKDLLVKMKKLSERWIPYRSYVCLHMWRYNDLKIEKPKKTSSKA